MAMAILAISGAVRELTWSFRCFTYTPLSPRGTDISCRARRKAIAKHVDKETKY